MAQPDFYKVLGVAEKATPDEIKKAYRKLAKRYHPDATGGDKSKEAKFKEVTQAYETLSDDKRRDEYDQIRQNPFPGMPPGGAGQAAGFSGFSGFDGFSGFGGRGRRGAGRGAPPMGGDIDEMLRQMKARMGQGGTPFSDLDGGGEAAGQNLQASLQISFREAALGAEKSVTLEPGTAAERRLTVRIPAGVSDGETIRLPGQGRPGAFGQAGHLLIKLQVAADAEHAFVRKGADVEIDLPIGLKEAVLGGAVEVPTLEGTRASLKLPPGTSSGVKIRLRGKGAGDKRGGRGDLFAIVQIQIPKDLSEEALSQFRAFLEKLG